MQYGFVIFVALTASFPLLETEAQSQETEKFASACGPKDVRTDIVLAGSDVLPHSVPPGKSLLILIEDLRLDRPGHRCIKCGDVTLSLAVDGQWVSGTKGFSHTFSLIDPGSHHVCVRTRKGNNDLPAMLSVQAEAGKTYYMVAVPQYEFDYYVERLAFADPDEGKFLMQVSKGAQLAGK